MKTKILLMLLAMVIALSAFASCNKKEEEKPSDNNQSSTDTGNNGGTEDDGTPEGPTYNTTWNNTEIRFSLIDDDCNKELTSGCPKYYSATAVGEKDEIDEAVRVRNLNAAKAAKVTPKFDYNMTGTWSSYIPTIVKETMSSLPTASDIFCNYVYDLSCAQLRNCFYNVLDTTKNANYFLFNKSDYVVSSDNYFDSEAGQGYFFEYMRSLTLSDDKMYIVASNYCIDLVRAFLVVPLNVQMMSQIKREDTWTGNMTSVADFYDLVWRANSTYEEGWTYNVLAHYSAKVYEDASASGCELQDVVGFAAGTTSGLVSSGFLYTTDVTIIAKDETESGYNYYYPANNTKLEEFATAITALFRDTVGVVTIDSETAKTENLGEGDLTAIRNRFAENKVLFGGIIAVGSLEDEVYQNMRTNGQGFGVLPVPTYKSGLEYKTLVHNIARVLAISKNTTEFAQCSAYLDYVSRTSADILNEFYEGRLTAATGGLAGTFNAAMLTYIRNHVRDCFDKTFEDSISNKISATDTTATENKWHELLSQNDFIYPSFASSYEANVEQKNSYLDMVYQDWLDESEPEVEQ